MNVIIQFPEEQVTLDYPRYRDNIRRKVIDYEVVKVDHDLDAGMITITANHVY